MTKEEKYLQCVAVGNQVMDLLTQVNDIVVFKSIIAATIQQWSENNHFDYGEIITDIAGVMLERRFEEDNDD